MKPVSRVLHLLLVLALLLNGLPGAAIAGQGMTDGATAGSTFMEDCPMVKAGGHATHGPAEHPNTAHQSAPTDGYCPAADCAHVCVHHGGAAIALAIVLSDVPASSVVVIAYAAALPSLTVTPPFRPPIV